MDEDVKQVMDLTEKIAKLTQEAEDLKKKNEELLRLTEALRVEGEVREQNNAELRVANEQLQELLEDVLEKNKEDVEVVAKVRPWCVSAAGNPTAATTSFAQGANSLHAPGRQASLSTATTPTSAAGDPTAATTSSTQGANSLHPPSSQSSSSTITMPTSAATNTSPRGSRSGTLASTSTGNPQPSAVHPRMFSTLLARVVMGSPEPAVAAASAPAAVNNSHANAPGHSSTTSRGVRPRRRSKTPARTSSVLASNTDSTTVGSNSALASGSDTPSTSTSSSGACPRHRSKVSARVSTETDGSSLASANTLSPGARPRHRSKARASSAPAPTIKAVSKISHSPVTSIPDYPLAAALHSFLSWAAGVQVEPPSADKKSSVPSSKKTSESCRGSEERFLDAAKQGRAEELMRLLSEGATVVSTESFGRSALHLAALGGHVDAVRALVCNNAPLDAQDYAMYTALHFAAREGHLRVLETLLQAGAPVEARTRFGATALHLAAANGRLECLQALLARGAEVDAADRDRQTALHMAAGKAHERCVKALVDAGADVARRDKWGKTAKDVTQHGNIQLLLT